MKVVILSIIAIFLVLLIAMIGFILSLEDEQYDQEVEYLKSILRKF